MILLQIAEIEQKSIILTTTICCGIRNLIILDWNRFLSVDVCGFCILAVSLTYLNQSEFKNKIIILESTIIENRISRNILGAFYTDLFTLSVLFVEQFYYRYHKHLQLRIIYDSLESAIL